MLARTIRHAALSLLFASPAAFAAEAAPPEKPFTTTFKDTALKWGPCPALFPKGCELAVVHGDPAKPNADVVIKLPPGTALARHWHTSAERIVLLAGRVTVTYDGSKPLALKPGAYAYGPAKLPHEAVCAKGGSPCVLFIAFEEPVDAFPALN